MLRPLEDADVCNRTYSLSENASVILILIDVIVHTKFMEQRNISSNYPLNRVFSDSGMTWEAIWKDKYSVDQVGEHAFVYTIAYRSHVCQLHL